MEAAGLSRATSESIAGRVRELITAGPWAERDVTEVAYDQAQQRTFRDIDAILARLETGIAAERTAMGVLLERLTSHAAAMGVLLESGRPLRPERTSS